MLFFSTIRSYKHAFASDKMPGWPVSIYFIHFWSVSNKLQENIWRKTNTMECENRSAWQTSGEPFWKWCQWQTKRKMLTFNLTISIFYCLCHRSSYLFEFATFIMIALNTDRNLQNVAISTNQCLQECWSYAVHQISSVVTFWMMRWTISAWNDSVLSIWIIIVDSQSCYVGGVCVSVVYKIYRFIFYSLRFMGYLVISYARVGFFLWLNKRNAVNRYNV